MWKREEKREEKWKQNADDCVYVCWEKITTLLSHSVIYRRNKNNKKCWNLTIIPILNNYF